MASQTVGEWKRRGKEKENEGTVPQLDRGVLLTVIKEGRTRGKTGAGLWGRIRRGYWDIFMRL